MTNAWEPLEPRRLFAAGDQDLTYGDGGFLRLKFADAAYQFLPGSDPTGTATVVAMIADGASFAVRRFNAGIPDATAGPDGTISTIPLPFAVPTGKLAAPARIWNLSGGRTLVEFVVPTSSTAADGFFVRLNPDKSLDTTYGTGGVRIWHGGFFLDVVQQGDKFVAIRKTGSTQPVERYTEDLQLDTTFGTNGVSNPGAKPSYIAIQPDGKIVLATQNSGFVIRLTPDGMLDPTFDDDGVSDGGNVPASRAIAVDTAGRIVVSAARAWPVSCLTDPRTRRSARAEASCLSPMPTSTIAISSSPTARC